ncbi:MAG: hypothetical protein KKA90_02675 [Nanoarchaeota archaeon]|nr:hypothetical protein [Nanoarchaeota archaeon]
MDLEEAQKKIMEFANHREAAYGFTKTPELILIHLLEELGEVARELSNKGLKRGVFDQEKLKEEVVDVLLETLVLAGHLDIDLEQMITRKIEQLYQRTSADKKADTGSGSKKRNYF